MSQFYPLSCATCPFFQKLDDHPMRRGEGHRGVCHHYDYVTRSHWTPTVKCLDALDDHRAEQLHLLEEDYRLMCTAS